jgi:hypothetical protein
VEGHKLDLGIRPNYSRGFELFRPSGRMTTSHGVLKSQIRAGGGYGSGNGELKPSSKGSVKSVGWNDHHPRYPKKKLCEEPEDGEPEELLPHPLLRTIRTPASSAFSEAQMLKMIAQRRQRHLRL